MPLDRLLHALFGRDPAAVVMSLACHGLLSLETGRSAHRHSEGADLKKQPKKKQVAEAEREPAVEEPPRKTFADLRKESDEQQMDAPWDEEPDADGNNSTARRKTLRAEPATAYVKTAYGGRWCMQVRDGTTASGTRPAATKTSRATRAKGCA